MKVVKKQDHFSNWDDVGKKAEITQKKELLVILYQWCGLVYGRLEVLY